MFNKETVKCALQLQEFRASQSWGVFVFFAAPLLVSWEELQVSNLTPHAKNMIIKSVFLLINGCGSLHDSAFYSVLSGSPCFDTIVKSRVHLHAAGWGNTFVWFCSPSSCRKYFVFYRWLQNYFLKIPEEVTIKPIFTGTFTFNSSAEYFISQFWEYSIYIYWFQQWIKIILIF